MAQRQEDKQQKAQTANKGQPSSEKKQIPKAQPAPDPDPKPKPNPKQEGKGKDKDSVARKPQEKKEQIKKSDPLP